MIATFLKKISLNFCIQIFMGKSSHSGKNHSFLHPRLQANCLSKLFFWWTFSSLTKGFTTGFKETDVYDLLPQYESSNLGDKLEQEWLREKTKQNPTLWRPLFKIFGLDFLALGIMIFINEFIVKLSQPLLIWKLITTHVVGDSHDNTSYVYAVLIVTSSFIDVLMYNWYIFKLRELAMKMRVACSSVIYRKSLRLSKNGVNKTATGQIVNLLSNDLNRFDKMFYTIHYMWAAPLQAIITFCLLFLILGFSATAGIGLFVIFIPVQIIMGTQYSELRLKTAIKTDERVRLLNEIVSGIQVIKMYTWEKLFIKFTNTLRKQEIRYIRGTSYLKAVQNAINKVLSIGAVFSCILLHVLTGNHLQSQYVFVVKSFYGLLKQSMTTNFPEAIKDIAEAIISINRIQNFLLSDETKSNHIKRTSLPIGIFLESVSTKWSSSTCETLSRINFTAGAGQLVTLVGSVGSGKTSLIKAILQELPLRKGTLAVKGKISYACQESWLFASTIKENILFGQSFDVSRYKEVIRVCALNRDFKIMPYGDNSIIGDRGITLSGGQKARINLARAIYRDADIYILDDPLAAVDTAVGKQLFEQCILGYLKNKCVILATHQIQFLKNSDWIYLLRSGKIVAEGDYEHIRNCSEDIAKLLQKEVDFDDSLHRDTEKDLKEKQEDKKFNERKNSGTIPFNVYREYLLSGGWCFFILIMLLFIFCQVTQSGTDYFQSYWVSLEDGHQVNAPSTFFTLNNCIYIYTGLISILLLSSISSSLSFFSYFMKTSIKLHNTMFSAVINAKLDFFYINPTGSILNRFSKDLGVADTYVPKSLIDTIQNGLHVLSIFTLVAVVNPWMLLCSFLLLSLFYLIRIIYLTTSRELKRIEAISRSPIYSHLNESLHGLETIRALGMQTRQKQIFDHFQNENTSVFHMLITLGATFRLWLSIFCSAYLALVASSCFWGRKIYGSHLGLIITQAMGLAELINWGMIQWSEFENEMTAVERIIQYKETEPEENEEKGRAWPLSGSIQFQKVSLKYKEDVPPALDNLDFTITSKEKVGIVGRTGAGKTSIISALFRLAKFEGIIRIGDVDINEVPLETVRSRISIIPQDPILFSGTVRENLDPFGDLPDSDLWAVLDDLELLNFVRQLPAGLESVILEKGSNLSVGQRQLFCLARALLRKNKILVLDEATANVDYKTDFLIQSTIKKKLKDCTVLIIAHRLHTIMDCDKVLVMDAGRTIEFDHPYKLLENINGALYDLVSKTGPTIMKHLKDIAQQNYTERSETTQL